MLLNRPNWRPHRPWFYFCSIGSLAALTWFLVTGYDAAAWPGGSSLPGFTFGVVGGLIIVFEMLLWLRKKLRVWRVGPAQAWLRAHIWLGLLCLPLLVLHSGLRFGGLLSTVLMLLLVVVVASGIWGLVLQNLLPRRMLDEVPAETIHSQIGHLALQLRDETAELVAATCGLAPEEVGVRKAEDDGEQDFVVIGAVRSVGGVQGKFVRTQVPRDPIADAEPLARFYREQVAPYLIDGAGTKSILGNPVRSAALFQSVRAQLPPAAHDVLGALEESCVQRRQWDAQARLHFWLHNWLLVHFPLSVALLAVMVVHVYVSLRFW